MIGLYRHTLLMRCENGGLLQKLLWLHPKKTSLFMRMAHTISWKKFSYTERITEEVLFNPAVVSYLPYCR